MAANVTRWRKFITVIPTVLPVLLPVPHFQVLVRGPQCPFSGFSVLKTARTPAWVPSLGTKSTLLPSALVLTLFSSSQCISDTTALARDSVTVNSGLWDPLVFGDVPKRLTQEKAKLGLIFPK